MISIDERVSALLKAAPGDPPITLDPERSIAGPASHRSTRSRLLPALAGAAVIAVAVTTALLAIPNSRTEHSVPSAPTDPRSAAHAEALAILHGVPLPPGAKPTDDGPTELRRGGVSVVSSREEKASGTWLAPGSVRDAIRFARAHPAAGFEANCTCGGSTVKWVTFLDEKSSRAIDYVIVPFQSGVAIKVTVVVAYVPLRPASTYVAEDASSVAITVERMPQGDATRGGAPTVRRILTGSAVRRLAKVANTARPEAPSTCIGPPPRVVARDILVFHETDRDVTFTMVPSNCPQFAVQAPGHDPAYIESTSLDKAVLHELGLPPDYGR